MNLKEFLVLAVLVRPLHIKGYVFEGLNTRTNEIVAIKRIQKVGNQLSRELEILTAIKDC